MDQRCFFLGISSPTFKIAHISAGITRSVKQLTSLLGLGTLYAYCSILCQSMLIRSTKALTWIYSWIREQDRQVPKARLVPFLLNTFRTLSYSILNFILNTCIVVSDLLRSEICMLSLCRFDKEAARRLSGNIPSPD